MSRPTPDDLRDPERFELIEEVAHDDLVPAVQAFLRPATPVKAAYYAANLLVGAGIGWAWWRAGTPVDRTLSHLGLGAVAGYVLLLPLHEWVHALTYRSLGASATRVVYRWRTLTAYCVADQFVATGREFALVCLMPFAVVNAALLAVILAVGGFAPVLWGMLLLHVGACSGDFAFANLAWLRRATGLRTYDDVGAGRSYFYAPRLDPTHR